jgi:hypothetical protein
MILMMMTQTSGLIYLTKITPRNRKRDFRSIEKGKIIIFPFLVIKLSPKTVLILEPNVPEQRLKQ